MTPLGRYRQAAGFLTALLGARALGISRVHLSKIECGSSVPSQELMNRMASLYQIGPDIIRRVALAQHRAYLKRRLAA